MLTEPQRFEIGGNVQIRIVVTDPDAIERVIGPNGDEWRGQFYNLKTAADVVEHWAYNAIANGVDDAYNLDGWADLPQGAVTFEVELTDLEVPPSVDMDDQQSVDRLYSRRDYWYGRSRANRWPLWISWLLAPTKAARRMCRELIQLKRSGVGV